MEFSDWFDALTERQQKEVQFAILYADEFSHGTDGHNRLELIARLARKVQSLENDKKELFDKIWEYRRKLGE